MDIFNNEIFLKFSQKLTRVFLRHGFKKLNNFIENLATSRKIEKKYSNCSQQIIEKTGNISERIFNIINHISDREKSKKSIPKLKLEDVKEKKSKIITAGKCNVLEKEIVEISNRQQILRVIRAWKKIINEKKVGNFKMNTILYNRFLKLSQKIFLSFKKYLKKRKAKASKIEIAKYFYGFKLMKNGFISLRKGALLSKKVKSIKVKNTNLLKSRAVATWINYTSTKQVARLTLERSLRNYYKHISQTAFNLLKIGIKLIKISKNHKELVMLFYNDKILKRTFKRIQRKININKIKYEKIIKSNKNFFRVSAKNALKYLKQYSIHSKKSAALKYLADAFYNSFNKHNFMRSLSSRVQIRKQLNENKGKALEFSNYTLTLKCLFLWQVNARRKRENKLQNYKSFLVHCKNLIEKSLYGWKKIYPRERYKRLRTLRLQNNQNWNVIDSYFSEWIRNTAQRVNKLNNCERLFKVKTIRKIFASWKNHYKQKLYQSLEISKKLQILNLKKKKKYLIKLKKYIKIRSDKHELKYGADLFYTYKLFRKWNLLNRKRVLLKWVTSYHYSKYLFTRWKNHAYDYKYSQYSRKFHQFRLKSKCFSNWRIIIRKFNKNRQKLESYIYYKNIKSVGVYFDKWLNIFHNALLQKYSTGASKKK